MQSDGEEKNGVSYAYDSMDRLTSLTNNGIITSYEYDKNGHMTKKAQDNGVETEYEYNKAGMVTRSETKKGGERYEKNN